MNKLIDRISIFQLAIMALLLGLAPFAPEPHLVEKVRWLFDGTPFKLIDWGDLVMHAAPVVLLIWKLVRMAQART